MHKASELMDVDHNTEIQRINNPDATAIEKSWEDVEFLLAEVDRLTALCDELQSAVWDLQP